MAEVNPMVAVNDTITVKCPKDKSIIAAFAIVANAAATFSIAPEVSYDDGANYAALTGIKPDQTTALALTAVGQSLWQRVPGATHVRLRCTAITTPATGTTGRINVAEGI